MSRHIYIADCRYYEDINRAFGDGRTILPSVCCSSLAAPVSCHPDMVLWPATAGVVVCAPEVYAEYKEMLSPFGIKLVQGMSRLSARYPADIAYNVLCVGNTAFALWNKTDRQICRLAEKQGVSRITVAQGYARCSTLPVGDGIISADPSICHAAKSAGLKVLTVSPGHILLPGYDYGFIGGASGLFEDDTVAFFGDPDTHPEGLFIRDFIKKQGFKLLDVPKRPLVDIGTILRIDL